MDSGIEFGIPYQTHQFGPTETINAILKTKNGMGLSPRLLNKLVLQYNRLNEYQVPKPGDVVKIPLLINE